MQLTYPDRVRIWLDALPRYRQGFGDLLIRRDGRTYACVMGVACDVARLNGAPVLLRNGNLEFVSDDGLLASIAVAAWLGVDPWELTVPTEALPVALAERVTNALVAARGVHLNDVVFTPYEHDGEWPLWLLNDARIGFADLADCIRVVLNLDTHLVAGTVEHEAAQLARDLPHAVQDEAQVSALVGAL